MCPQIDSDWKAILFNILGGIIVSVLTWLYLKLARKIVAIRFRRLFGDEPSHEIILTYGKMFLSPCYDEKGKLRDFPYNKPDIPYPYRVSSILSDTEAISIKYISDMFSKVTNESPTLSSDEPISDKLDISYLAFGGLNNKKSIQVLNSEDNTFYKFGQGSIISKTDDKEVYKITTTTDYALIIRIKPRQFSNRNHFCIAGIGESGTRGASYLLSHKWKEVLKKTKGKEFGLIIKVTNNIDESAEIINCKLKD